MLMFSPMTSELLTTAEVATTFRVTEATVTSWVREGKLRASRTPGGKSYLFRRSDVDAFLVPAEPATEATA